MNDDAEDPRPNTYAVMWDMYGLEAIERVPHAADTTFALLKGEKPPEHPNILHWELRARYNTQRHYEIYVISTAPGIELEDIKQLFEDDPQYAADLIRKRGHCHYSDRVEEAKVVIK